MSLNLAALPVPEVIEVLDFEAILQKKIEKLQSLEHEWQPLESDPALKELQVAAYEEMILRQRINDSAKACMLAWSTSTDLENLAVIFELERLVIQEEDNSTTPPTPAILESDESLKERCLLAWSTISTAGARKAYIAHARNASPSVKDANAYRVAGGQVAVVILSHSVDGAANQELLDVVAANLSEEDVRPLCSEVVVKSATIHEFKLQVTLDIGEGVAAGSIVNAARKRAWEYVRYQHRIGAKVSESALKAALHVFGVDDVDLHGFTSITTDRDTAPYCYDIKVNSKDGRGNLPCY